MSRIPAWLLRLAAVVVVFGAVAVWRSHEVGIPFRDPQGQYLTGKIAISVGVFAGCALLDAVLRTAGRRTPRAVLRTLRVRWTAGRLALAWAALLCYHLVYFTYHNLKSWDVLNAPRDGLLTRVDQWLFLGHSPAVLLHDLLGQGAAAWALIGIYESFPTMVTVSFVAAVAMQTRVRDGAVFVASMVWCWILGTASYYAIPSLGPFHERPQDFAGLPTSMVTRTQAFYLAQRDDLLAHPHAPDAFAQISAFASLHCAITTVILLMAARYRMRRTTIALGVFLAATLVATVYLGWHFAVDDVAGVAIGAAAVWLGARTISPGQRDVPSGGEHGRAQVHDRLVPRAS